MEWNTSFWYITVAAELKLDCGGQAKGESRRINWKIIAAIQSINGPGVEIGNDHEKQLDFRYINILRV